MSVYKNKTSDINSIVKGIDSGSFVKLKNSKELDCFDVEKIACKLFRNEPIFNNGFSVHKNDLDFIPINPNVAVKDNAVMIVEGSHIEALGMLFCGLDKANTYYIDLPSLSKELGFYVENDMYFDSLVFSAPKNSESIQFHDSLKFDDIKNGSYIKKIDQFVNNYFDSFDDFLKEKVVSTLLNKVDSVVNKEMTLIEYSQNADVKRIHKSNQKLKV